MAARSAAHTTLRLRAGGSLLAAALAAAILAGLGNPQAGASNSSGGPAGGSTPTHPYPHTPTPPEIVSRWTERPIHIDGSGSDPAWKAAAVVDRFPLPWLGKA